MKRFLGMVMAGAALCATAPAFGGSDLLYLEGQLVGGYSSEAGEAIWYSMDQGELMQKPSIGFDWVHRFSGETGDVAQLALQVRLAWNGKDEEGELERAELQIYNAYLKYKAGWSDLWIGRNRPAMGLSSTLDSHGLLLPTLAMLGFGYDRDWGIGLSRDTGWGNISASLTTGTGAPLRFSGNHLASARVAVGVPSRDNWSLGLTGSFGRTMMTMGNLVVDDKPADLALGGLDLVLFRNQWEHRLDLFAGTLRGDDAFGAAYRLSWQVDADGRFKAEAQPAWTSIEGEEGFSAATSLSFQATTDLAARVMYAWDEALDDHRVVAQLYYYHRLF
jgi:hypothetical protein